MLCLSREHLVFKVDIRIKIHSDAAIKLSLCKHWDPDSV